MPRPPIRRLVEHLPPATYFKPAGVPLRHLDEVTLSVDEVEALRLKDLEGLEQETAAARMGVARTTFRRVLIAAREKLADALVHGKAIRIEGGPFLHVSPGLVCAHCGVPRRPAEPGQGRGAKARCPRCGGSQWVSRTPGRGAPGRGPFKP